MNNPLFTRSRPVVQHLRGRPMESKWMQAFRLRDRLRQRYACGVPDEEAIGALVDLGSIVEIGAGSGYWASLIDEMGGDVLAFDALPPGSKVNSFFPEGRVFYEVHRHDHTIAEHFPGRALFMCWPSDFNQERGWSDDALERYLRAGGQTLAVVSEGRRGAAGSNRLFDLTREKMERIRTIALPTFPQLHDHLTIYKAEDV